jgi:hypothetical protein
MQAVHALQLAIMACFIALGVVGCAHCKDAAAKFSIPASSVHKAAAAPVLTSSTKAGMQDRTH